MATVLVLMGLIVTLMVLLEVRVVLLVLLHLTLLLGFSVLDEEVKQSASVVSFLCAAS